MDDRGWMADPLSVPADGGADQSLGGEKGHLAVVVDRALHPVMARQIGDALRKPPPDRGKRVEFDVGAARITDGPAQQAGVDTGGKRVGRGHQRLLCYLPPVMPQCGG